MHAPTDAALASRIRRALTKQGQQLRKAAPADRSSVGNFFVVNALTNSITSTHWELAELADDLSLLTAGERQALGIVRQVVG